MATVEIELRNYTRRDGTRPIVLRVTAGDEVSRKQTGLYVKPEEWDKKKRRVNRRHSEWSRINDAIDALVKEAEGVKADAIKERVPVRPGNVTKALFAIRDFYEAAEAIRAKYEKAGKYNTQKNYESMIALLKRYSPELAIEDITPEFLEGYRRHLQELGKKYNTVVFHLSKISAVLGTVKNKIDPFKEVTIGAYRPASKKILLTIEDLARMYHYRPEGKWDRIAKDTFLFSVFAAGMSSSDVLQLKPEQISNGRIDYRRNKVKDSSGIELSVSVNPLIQEILDRQDKNKSTVFGLVTMFGEGEAACREREKIQSSINRALKSIALATGIGKPIKFKWARAAWAQILNKLSDGNVKAIQDSLGHTKYETTQIYLGSDPEEVDKLLGLLYREFTATLANQN